MGRKTAKILGGIFLLIAVTALIVLFVTLLHKDSPETSKDTPTKAPTPSISVPEGSVLVWRLAEVTSESNSGERYVSSRYEYDERGLCISSKEYYDDNEPKTECEFSYDEDTKCTTVTVLEHKTVSMGALSAMDSTDNKSVYVLNPEGVKLSEERYDFIDGAYELRYKYEYEYNSEGAVIRRTGYGLMDEGVFYMTGEQTYDWLGNILVDYDAGNSAYSWHRSTYVRDNYGHIIEELHEYAPGGDSDPSDYGTSELDSQGRVVMRTEPAHFAEEPKLNYWKYEYQYFDDGGWRDISYDLYGEISEITEYDVYGNKTKEESYYNGKLTRGKTWEYEPRRGGYMLRCSGYGDTKNEEFSYRYEYDDAGNRIRIEALLDGEWQTIAREEYNDAGQIVRIERNLYTCEFLFDENGNYKERIYTALSEGRKSIDSYTYVPIVITEEELRLAEEYCQPAMWTVPGSLWPDNITFY